MWQAHLLFFGIPFLSAVTWWDLNRRSRNSLWPSLHPYLSCWLPGQCGHSVAAGLYPVCICDISAAGLCPAQLGRANSRLALWSSVWSFALPAEPVIRRMCIVCHWPLLQTRTLWVWVTLSPEIASIYSLLLDCNYAMNNVNNNTNRLFMTRTACLMRACSVYNGQLMCAFITYEKTVSLSLSLSIFF